MSETSLSKHIVYSSMDKWVELCTRNFKETLLLDNYTLPLLGLPARLIESIKYILIHY